MNIAVIGLGAIGTTFAYLLSRGGHQVTVVARGERLKTIRRDGSLVHVNGNRAQVQVAESLDTTVEYDLVLVTVLAHQLGPLEQRLQQSRARQVMFMFNTVDSLSRLRELVGDARFVFAFPSVVASLPNDQLTFKVFKVGQVTLCTDARWALVFSSAGITCRVQPQMQTWLRTHAVVIAVLQALASLAYRRQHGLSLRESWRHAQALSAGFSLVRQLEGRLVPLAFGVSAWVPAVFWVPGLWALSRSPLVRTLGAAGPREPRALIEALVALRPEGVRELSVVMPETVPGSLS